MRKRYILSLVFVLTAFGARAQDSCHDLQRIGTFQHKEIGSIPIWEEVGRDHRWLGFVSEMAVDTDGAPDSYHPEDLGITHLCNGLNVGPSCEWKAECMPDYRKAKAEGFQGPTRICFFAMATDAHGIPLIQGENDPKPGYFVSTTALKQPEAPDDTPHAQLDANEIPFVVIPTIWQSRGFHGVKLGDFVVAYRKSNSKLSFAIVGDLGPKNQIGEGSVALHKALGNDPFQIRFGKRRARKGISSRDVVYFIFSASRIPGKTITKELIEQEGLRLANEFGGEEHFRSCANRM